MEATVEEESAECVWTYLLVPLNNSNSERSWCFTATRPQGVPLKEGYTYDLRIGDVLIANGFDVGYAATAWGHGFMLRLGLTSVDSLEPEKFPEFAAKLRFGLQTNQYTSRPTVPKATDSIETKASFIKGYLAADGDSGIFATANKELYDFFIDNAGLAGCVLTGQPHTHRKSVRAGFTREFYDQHRITYAKGSTFNGYRVKTLRGPSEVRAPVFKVYSDSEMFVTEGGWLLLSD